VRNHLDAVSGWFTLTGLDDLFEQRMVEADRAAAQIIDDARAEAATIIRDAESESRAIRQGARQQAALERRGKSRVGRPVGLR
jgi:dsDNA-specific endonuclease/ATPase MutS2